MPAGFCLKELAVLLGMLLPTFTGFPSHCWVFVCAQSCLTLCGPMDCSPLGTSVRGISQDNTGRILEWVAISYSRGSSQSRDWPCISYISCTGRWALYHQCLLGSLPLLRLQFRYSPTTAAMVDVQGSASPSFTHPLPSQPPSSPPQQLACFFFCGSTVWVPPPMTSFWGGGILYLIHCMTGSSFSKHTCCLAGCLLEMAAMQIALLSEEQRCFCMEHKDLGPSASSSSLTIQLLPALVLLIVPPGGTFLPLSLSHLSFLSWAGTSTGIFSFL